MILSPIPSMNFVFLVALKIIYFIHWSKSFSYFPSPRKNITDLSIDDDFIGHVSVLASTVGDRANSVDDASRNQSTVEHNAASKSLYSGAGVTDQNSSCRKVLGLAALNPSIGSVNSDVVVVVMSFAISGWNEACTEAGNQFSCSSSQNE
jgi:hypothetical protein